jgi:hypothetical protein
MSPKKIFVFVLLLAALGLVFAIATHRLPRFRQDHVAAQVSAGNQRKVL